VPLEDPDAVLFCGREGPEEVWRTRERAWRILDTLPKHEREVLRLRLPHGYTAPEIGQALGLTPSNVCILQMRALRRAATHLDPEARVAGEASVKETGPMDDRLWPVE
jgi:DNA-directed RNA polymerase specialized sigma24 family protein